MGWEDELRRVVERYQRKDPDLDLEDLHGQLYVMIREADVGSFIEKLRDTDVRIADGFIAFLRDLHGERPDYNILFLTNCPPPRDPPEVVDAIHAWLKSH